MLNIRGFPEALGTQGPSVLSTQGLQLLIVSGDLLVIFSTSRLLFILCSFHSYMQYIQIIFTPTLSTPFISQHPPP